MTSIATINIVTHLSPYLGQTVRLRKPTLLTPQFFGERFKGFAEFA